MVDERQNIIQSGMSRLKTQQQWNHRKMSLLFNILCCGKAGPIRGLQMIKLSSLCWLLKKFTLKKKRNDPQKNEITASFLICIHLALKTLIIVARFFAAIILLIRKVFKEMTQSRRFFNRTKAQKATQTSKQKTTLLRQRENFNSLILRKKGNWRSLSSVLTRCRTTENYSQILTNYTSARALYYKNKLNQLGHLFPFAVTRTVSKQNKIKMVSLCSDEDDPIVRLLHIRFQMCLFLNFNTGDPVVWLVWSLDIELTNKKWVFSCISRPWGGGPRWFGTIPNKPTN